jgi:5'-phosphate synthase pdxT subunit
MSPRVGVLALQGDVREHLQAFERAGADPIPIRTADELGSIDALAIPGGESTTISRLLRVFELEQPLRERLRQGMPCFATCAGLIVLSREIVDGRTDQTGLGAFDITVRRNGYGRQVASFEADLEIDALDPAAFHALFIRAPRIESAGASVEVLAELEGDPVAVSQGPHLGLVFHPELTDDIRLHRLFVSRLAG